MNLYEFLLAALEKILQYNAAGIALLLICYMWWEKKKYKTELQIGFEKVSDKLSDAILIISNEKRR